MQNRLYAALRWLLNSARSLEHLLGCTRVFDGGFLTSRSSSQRFARHQNGFCRTDP